MKQFSMTERDEIDDGLEKLIDWFKEQKMSPVDAAQVAMRLIAEQMVAKDQNRNVDELQDAITKMFRYLTMEVSRATQHYYGEREPENAEGLN